MVWFDFLPRTSGAKPGNNVTCFSSSLPLVVGPFRTSTLHPSLGLKSHQIEKSEVGPSASIIKKTFAIFFKLLGRDGKLPVCTSANTYKGGGGG